MKINLLTLLVTLAVLLITSQSCSDSNEPKKASTLEGNWTFESSSTSGSFKINEDLEVISGTFTVFGNHHVIAITQAITDTKIILNANGNSLVFLDYTINNDYTEIEALKMEYSAPTVLIRETVTIKRQ